VLSPLRRYETERFKIQAAPDPGSNQIPSTKLTAALKIKALLRWNRIQKPGIHALTTGC
jgi:hypothetical protein